MKIAIDAGHGDIKYTAGKRTPDGYAEHWANVMVASYFAQAMDRCGVPYIKTGWNDDNATDDVDTALSTRQKQIKAAKCDYSISFHFNAYGDGKTYNGAQGIETLISNKYPADSKRLAECIQKYLIKGTKQTNRGVKTQSLAMCNCSVMGTKASVLIECGFMTNEYEAKLMQSHAFCKECAEEAAQGFCEYAGIKYVPAGNTAVIAPATQSQTYVVQKGDTLSGIGRKFNVKWQDIALKNNIKSPYTIRVGQKIIIK
ncbi:MAG: N-acetylmuramoyl-L-alanine amidase [Prevotella sp.]|nr:N-acetylmuramoyl-L-alanine amidase [Candidatus Prevotella equi]